MPTETPTKPVESPIPKINDELAVGSDLEFQRRWWKFETGIWVVFTIIILLDALGAFGHGILAKAHWRSRDRRIEVTYDRIERFSAPSVLMVKFSPAAVHGGKVQLWAGDVMVKELGNTRVVPTPQNATLSDNGILYTFTTDQISDTVELTLEPKKPGLFHLALRYPGSEQLNGTVVVLP